MSAIVVIPARYASTRFPGKPLASLMGKPMIQHVYERAKLAMRASEVVVATDSEEIFRAVEGFGGRAVMTSSAHQSGTDRAAEVASRNTPYDIIVNVQGDEPMIRPELIDSAIALIEEDQSAHMGTFARPITDSHMMRDPNVVKVAVGRGGFALYFSRAPIPYQRDIWPTLADVGRSTGMAGGALYQHIGIYSYSRSALIELAGLEPTPLELAEKLEQLRALEHGMRIKVAFTDYETIGVDTPEDMKRVEKCLSLSS